MWRGLWASLLVVSVFIADEGPGSVHFWNRKGEERLRRLLRGDRLVSKPKNVIFFLGDGMGISLLTASRSYEAMKKSLEDPTPNHFFEDFPTAGLVKTASLNTHVTDSAAGAVALFAGQKVNQEFLLTSSSSTNCSDGNKSHINFGIAELAVNSGMNAGFVTTTRVTHATPAALYAKGVTRHMEYDVMVQNTSCTDIAMQLLDYPANTFKVIFGGGSSYIKPTSDGGIRQDGRSIKKEWEKMGGRRVVIENFQELETLNPAEVDYLMGTFAPSNFPYHLDELLNNTKTVPSLTEMTTLAIRMMETENKGYFLMVEGGLIDYSEHLNQLHFAYEELSQFELAIQRARELTDSSETLIIVTADHSHALSIPGYTRKAKDLMGTDEHWFKMDVLPESERVMPGLLFAAGPGYFTKMDFDNKLKENPFFATPSAIALRRGVHGGDDVGIWADGPGHWLFSGTIENTQVAYTIKSLLCLIEEMSVCRDEEAYNSELDYTVLILVILLFFCLIATAVSILLYVREVACKRDNGGKVNPSSHEMSVHS